MRLSAQTRNFAISECKSPGSNAGVFVAETPQHNWYDDAVAI
jgi:hypothetical protein